MAKREAYFMKNMYAQTISQIAVQSMPHVWEGLLEDVCEELANEDEVDNIDFALRILIGFLYQCSHETH